ncbi:hypothetical protein K402DRAFT_4296 [Aulographum hederae CBS 113979]|uniref:Uncharacterized protein n=1 Tax=Aulographum hederae CBS 113979 TaxID=1176131 RepID=A0A6G1HGI6_9PEZI|nr:hypothetical protein K402DRAFT_4296 [Aulographum hederae CBS 113979]
MSKPNSTPSFTHHTHHRSGLATDPWPLAAPSPSIYEDTFKFRHAPMPSTMRFPLQRPQLANRQTTNCILATNSCLIKNPEDAPRSENFKVVFEELREEVREELEWSKWWVRNGAEEEKDEDSEIELSDEFELEEGFDSEGEDMEEGMNSDLEDSEDTEDDFEDLNEKMAHVGIEEFTSPESPLESGNVVLKEPVKECINAHKTTGCLNHKQSTTKETPKKERKPSIIKKEPSKPSKPSNPFSCLYKSSQNASSPCLTETIKTKDVSSAHDCVKDIKERSEPPKHSTATASTARKSSFMEFHPKKVFEECLREHAQSHKTPLSKDKAVEKKAFEKRVFPKEKHVKAIRKGH